MQSHLTRNVFRQILRNRTLVHAQCMRRIPSNSAALSNKYTLGSRILARSFLWQTQPERKKVIQTPDHDPGFRQLVEVGNTIRMGTRPPEKESIAKALREFFGYKSRTPSSILLDVQVHYSLDALKYLLVDVKEGELPILSLEDLLLVLRSLSKTQHNIRPELLVEFADLVYDQIRKLSPELSFKGQLSVLEKDVLELYVRALVPYHQGTRLRDFLEDLELDPKESSKLWADVLRAFILEDNEQELNKTISMMQKQSVDLDEATLLVILQTYAKSRNFEAVDKWYKAWTDRFGEGILEADLILLRMCIHRQDFENGQPLVNRLLARLEKEPNKKAWDLIFEWAAANLKGVDEVGRMMDVMVRRNKELASSDEPDSETINGLVQIAHARDDHYTAERYIALAERRAIALDGNTHLLQMDYRLKVGDLDGARHALRQAQKFEISSQLETSALNRLIQALCAAPRPDFDAVMECVDDLTDGKATFELKTIAALTVLHLKREEIHDVINLLQTHAFHYGFDERKLLEGTFISFILDRNNPASQAWEAYTILRGIFTETDKVTRIAVMNEFFARERCDLAIHVFGNMRQAKVRSGRPSAADYAQCFAGIGRCADEESLGVVYNMLKLDSEVEPDTHLRNALMLACNGCGQPLRALEFWEDILRSKEGPTYSSIVIALRACELCPVGGVKRANSIWTRLQRFKVEPTVEIYAAYVGALAGQGLVDEACEAVGNMSIVMSGTEPEVLTIGTLINASRLDKRPQAEQWAATNHPAVYTELEALGRNIEDGSFKLERKVVL